MTHDKQDQKKKYRRHRFYSSSTNSPHFGIFKCFAATASFFYEISFLQTNSILEQVTWDLINQYDKLSGCTIEPSIWQEKVTFRQKRLAIPAQDFRMFKKIFLEKFGVIWYSM